MLAVDAMPCVVSDMNPDLLQGPEPVCDLLPANLPVATQLHLDAGNGGHLQLPHILLKVVTASSRKPQSSLAISLPSRSTACSHILKL